MLAHTGQSSTILVIGGGLIDATIIIVAPFGFEHYTLDNVTGGGKERQQDKRTRQLDIERRQGRLVTEKGVRRVNTSGPRRLATERERETRTGIVCVRVCVWCL